ncbi:MAG: serine--tRNA ligase [Gammaproteobacteria bacterium]
MLDPELLRRDFAAVAANLRRRGPPPDAEEFARLESRRRETQRDAESLRGERNRRAKSGARPAPADAAESKNRLRAAEAEMRDARAQLDDYLLRLPNLLHDSVPEGEDETANAEVSRWGEMPSFSFQALDHVALGARMRMMDFDSAAAMAAARFVVLTGDLSRMHRALAQFMLDLHTREHGYVEHYLPHLANARAMTGAGQLPKFAGEVFFADADSLYLIPTAEVALVNMARARVWDAAELPLRLAAHTACYRREAGAYGKDTRGMLRQHQFDKVELVQMRAPEDSYAGLEEMRGHAERVLRLLELPYRVVVLCAGDTGFAAAKTYDLEVWMPGQNRYREISSCSNCGAFQSRRLNARCRAADGDAAHIHMLNGSGVAVGRALIAVLENHQREDGAVRVPPPLVPYMGGREWIGATN